METIFRYSQVDFAEQDDLKDSSSLLPSATYATWPIDNQSVTLSYTPMEESKGLQDQKIELDELMSYPIIHWRIANSYNIHPSNLTDTFLNESLTESRKIYEKECARAGVSVCTPEFCEKEILAMDKFFAYIKTNKKFPPHFDI